MEQDRPIQMTVEKLAEMIGISVEELGLLHNRPVGTEKAGRMPVVNEGAQVAYRNWLDLGVQVEIVEGE